MEFKPYLNHPPVFRLFTRESLTKISRRIQEEKLAKELLKQQEQESGTQNEEKKDEDRPRPNPLLMQGMTLPTKMGEFPPELFGIPIEDIDDYYHNKYTFVVVAKDKTIFRFSSSNGFFFLSPFNPLRRIAIYILTHPFFSLCVMLVILVNCVFMAINKEFPHIEATFTGIYTVEGTVKMLARGFILANFTYLRDAWNWLDFIVVAFAYVTMALSDVGGKVTVLRTFRVLRALKTVAVVPGLKTIVGALMEAVRRLRDVMILSLFVLSIFALIGLQLYQGSLMKKCVLKPDNYTDEGWDSLPKQDQRSYASNKSFWQDYPVNRDGKICGDSGSQCANDYFCVESWHNPDFGYTNYDNFGWALLCAFRLMTQDYWENLYQLTIKANGLGHMLFFIIVIFLGSFYLVNLILAIVAMSYDDCRKQDQEAEDAQAEEAIMVEEARQQQMEDAVSAALFVSNHRQKSLSEASYASLELFMPKRVQATDKECISMKSECGLNHRCLSIVNGAGQKISTSLPGSPFNRHRGNHFNWCRSFPNPPSTTTTTTMAMTTSRRPIVLPCLENIDLPYADDSEAITPISEDLCNVQNAQNFQAFRQCLGSSAGGGGGPRTDAQFSNCARKASYTSRRYSSHAVEFSRPRTTQDRKCEPTHFHWAMSVKHKVPPTSDPVVGRGRLEADDMPDDWESCKEKLFIDNPFVCHTPSPTAIDMRDVLVIKDLIKGASCKKSNFLGMEGQSKKEFIKAKCNQLLFGWECHPAWYRFARFIELFIMDAFVDLFITLCIVINTLFMAMEHDGMMPTMISTLKIGNYVFTCIFTLEAVLKIVALGLYKYLEDKWSCFDIVIVILSLVELGLSGVRGLSILRSFRLLRVFKLAKSWPTLNLLIGIIGRTMGALGNLCFVLAIIIFIFAVMGMQLFGPSYETFYGRDSLPGWNFTDFLHSFMIVFRVLCGEWIESMWNCLRCCDYSCIPFFLLTMIIGNLVVLNLFLALLLSSFGAESLKHSEEDEGPNKLQEAIDRINRFGVFVKSHILYCIKVKGRQTVLALHECDSASGAAKPGLSSGGGQFRNGRIHDRELSLEDPSDSPEHHCDTQALTLRLVKGTPMSHVAYSPITSYAQEDENCTKEVHFIENHLSSEHSTLKMSVCSPRPSFCGNTSPSSASSTSTPKDSQKSMLSSSNFSLEEEEVASGSRAGGEGPEIHDVKVVFIKYPDECCPTCCTRICTCLISVNQTCVGKLWSTFRLCMFRLVENNYFETFIIIMILLSSLALAIEDVYIENEDRRLLKIILKGMDKAFTIIFVFEMVIKQSAYGFKKYFTDAWCWLDFVIVVISLISLFAESIGYGNIGAFRALRTLRALRPLRAVSRWEGMKVVVNALIQAIPAIFNVLLVCLVFWLIFSIMGVNLFGGKFKQCIDENGRRVNASEVPNKTECESRKILGVNNYTWYNPKITFDNVLIGYLALFQVATFKGWVDIMDNAIDSKPEEDLQPDREHRSGMYLYFVFFIVFGSFFTLNLFIGVIIENFNMQKKKAGGSLEMLMTEDQKKYYNAMKKLGSKQPQKPIPKPKVKIQLLFFQVTTSQKFDIVIMIVILLNMTVMAIEHYDESYELQVALNWINQVFIIIFTFECIMKLIGLRQYYFKQPWNIFDFIVVLSSLITAGLQEHLQNFPISPTLLRVVRVFRVGRVLRLVKSAKGIRTLLFSLAVSMPALFNIGLLLFLVMFIYSIFGMSFFMHVRRTKGIDDMFNFETFFRSMILLFQVSTSAGWDGVLAGLMNDKDCNPTATEVRPNGDCGSPGEAVVFLVTYLVISFLVVINMYIAVILENFSQATEDVQQGLTQDDFDMYYEVWERFDENATQYIAFNQLSEFVDALELPLRLSKPNFYKLVTLDIPICEDDRIHCVDILDALTKNFLGTIEAAGELGDLKKGPERRDYRPVSSTLKRQREIYVVRAIERMWRDHVRRKQGAAAGAVGGPSGVAAARSSSVQTRTMITIDEVDVTEASPCTEATKDSDL